MSLWEDRRYTGIRQGFTMSDNNLYVIVYSVQLTFLTDSEIINHLLWLGHIQGKVKSKELVLRYLQEKIV